MKKVLSFVLLLLVFILPIAQASYPLSTLAANKVTELDPATGFPETMLQDPRGVDLWLTPAKDNTIGARSHIQSQPGRGGSGDQWVINIVGNPNPSAYILYPVLDVTNMTGSNYILTLILACYDINNRLLALTTTTAAIGDSETVRFSASLTKPFGTERSTLYFWDSNFVPICMPFEFASNSTDEISIPENLSETSATTDIGIGLEWQSVSGADDYEISIDYSSALISTGNVTAFFVSGLSPKTEYSVRIRAANGDIKSDWSEEVSIWTKYSGPENLVVTSTTRESFSISWDPVASADSYEADLSGTILSLGDETSTVIGDLEEGMWYLVKVRAIIGGEASAWSETIFVITESGGTQEEGPFSASVEVNAVNGDDYQIAVSSMFMSAYNGMEIVLEYDDTVFDVVSMSTLTNIAFTQISPGEIRFVLDIDVSEGTIDLLTLSAVKTENSFVKMYNF